LDITFDMSEEYSVDMSLSSIDPLVHLVPTDVPHHVINVEQASGPRYGIILDRPISREKRAVVGAALDKRVNRVAVSANAGENNTAVLVRTGLGLGKADCATAGCLAPCLRRIVDPKRDDPHAVAVPLDMLGNGPAAEQWCGQHKADLALLHDIRSAIAQPRLGSSVGNK
jgi:hypothetical protein